MQKKIQSNPVKGRGRAEKMLELQEAMSTHLNATDGQKEGGEGGREDKKMPQDYTGRKYFVPQKRQQRETKN